MFCREFDSENVQNFFSENKVYFIFQHIVQSSFKHLSYPICQQTSECPMLRTMLAAVHATEKRLIAPQYI